MQVDPHRWYTTGDVAGLLGVSRETARRWAQVGELPARQFARRGSWRVYGADLIRWLRARGLAVEEPPP